MIQSFSPTRLHFGAFELHLRTGELRKNGLKVRVQDQPIRLLAFLASHPGELVTRVEIQKALWGEDQFVEFEHAINTAVRKIREALGDDPDRPEIIETLPRKGYRFIAEVEEIYGEEAEGSTGVEATDAVQNSVPTAAAPESLPPAELPVRKAAQAEPEASFSIRSDLARWLFLLIQTGYLAMYCAALVYFEALGGALSAAGYEPVSFTLPLAIGLAMCGVAVRIYLLSAVGWSHPAAGRQFRRLFPALFVLDAIWAASPLLAAGRIGFGVALAAVGGFAYLPFAQRTLMESIDRRATREISGS